nr:glycosyltransferase family 2 protein [Bacteroidota bacterium]
MENKPDLIVVIPVYNEAEIVEHVIMSWVKKLKSLEIHFQIRAYNDGSKDHSLKVLQQVKMNPPFLVITNKENSGHGPTILQGYRESMHAEWVLQVDSDNEINPDCFDEFWKIRHDHDFLIGIRKNRQSTFVRKLISAFSRITITALFGCSPLDANCPFRLMRSDTFEDIIKNIPENMLVPNLIISGEACSGKMRVAELPVNFTYRKTGTPSLKYAGLVRMVSKSFSQAIIYKFK